MGGFESIVQFGFVVALPLVLAAGALVSLLALGALFDALDNPQQVSARIDAAFRRAPKPPRRTRDSHYYRAYWESGPSPEPRVREGGLN